MNCQGPISQYRERIYFVCMMGSMALVYFELYPSAVQILEWLWPWLHQQLLYNDFVKMLAIAPSLIASYWIGEIASRAVMYDLPTGREKT